ncbi:MAG TPA: shikimate dehydrogenase, partial [Tepidimicrobium sp.]|nr:shikimate dehydrogenase [Tepidimicrobium sp.]
MNITWDTEIYCLIGHPISKSLSPVIHNSFYNINNLNNIYIAFDI